MSGAPAAQAASDEFAAQLRAAIARRGLSLDRLRYHLAQNGHEVSTATLSYWQSGRSRPERARSLAALGALEGVLGLAAGELTGLINTPGPGRPRRRPSAGRRDPVPVDSGYPPMRRLMDELGLEFDDGYERVSAHETVVVRPDRSDGPCTVREVLRATRDGFDRFPVAVANDEPNAYLFCVPIGNCRLGRVAESPKEVALVAELLLERPLMAGESMIVEYRVEAAGGTGTATEWERVCAGPLRSIHVEVRFPDDDLPLSAEVYEAPAGLPEVVRPLPIVGRSVQVLEESFGPGRLGVRWVW